MKVDEKKKIMTVNFDDLFVIKTTVTFKEEKK